MNSIKKGDKIRVKDNLKAELDRLGFTHNPAFIKRFAGSKRTAYDVYTDEESGEQFVTVDLCCEIPYAACEKIG